MDVDVRAELAGLGDESLEIDDALAERDPLDRGAVLCLIDDGVAQVEGDGEGAEIWIKIDWKKLKALLKVLAAVIGLAAALHLMLLSQ